MLFTAINVDENSKDFEEMTEEAENRLYSTQTVLNRDLGRGSWADVSSLRGVPSLILCAQPTF